MKQLLIRADDLGYSYAVNLGIARTVNEGVIRSVGLMPNMTMAEHGWSLVADADIAIGQHTNLCLGTPCSNPERIASMVEEDGTFKSSNTYREAYRRGEDFVDFDECVLEVKAQLERFRQIVGRDPDYFEAHAVMSDNLFRAIHEVATREGLKEQPMVFDPTRELRCGTTTHHMLIEDMLPPEQYDPQGFIRRTVESMEDGETNVCVFHPGYLDAFILKNSSLTTNRTKEVDALIDPSLRTWLKSRSDLRLIDYRDM